MKSSQCLQLVKKWLLIFVVIAMCLKFLISLTPIPIGFDETFNLYGDQKRLISQLKRPFGGNFSKKVNFKNINVMPLSAIPNDVSEALEDGDTTYHHGNKFVTLTRARGRLGNQMFQLAALVGISNTYKYIPAVFKSEFKDIFYIFELPNNKSISISDKIGSNYIYKEPDADLFAERDITQYSDVSRINSSQGNWTIDGYFQSYKYFNHVPQEVRQLFKFRNKFISPAKSYFLQHKLSGTVVIGMHIRRGDFLSEYHQSLGRTTVDADYVTRAMDFYRNWYKSKITFLVFSNDITWCQDNIKDQQNTILFSHFDHPGYDLALMSLCDHMIMSVGTFGWWGGWLAGGHVVYFKGYPRPGSEIDKYFNKDDFYPPEWTGLD